MTAKKPAPVCSNCGHWLANHDFDEAARVRTTCLRCTCLGYQNEDGYQVPAAAGEAASLPGPTSGGVVPGGRG